MLTADGYLMGVEVKTGTSKKTGEPYEIVEGQFFAGGAAFVAGLVDDWSAGLNGSREVVETAVKKGDTFPPIPVVVELELRSSGAFAYTLRAQQIKEKKK